MRLTVVSPFLDRLHGTELCIIEQIENFASRHSWEIHLYSQNVKDVRGLRLVTDLVADSPGSIFGTRSLLSPGLISLTIFGGSLQITGNDGETGDPEESVQISFILRESIAWMQT